MQRFSQPQGAQLQGQGKELLELKAGVSIPAEGACGELNALGQGKWVSRLKAGYAQCAWPKGEHPTQAPTQAY